LADGVPVGIVLGDPAYGDETAFRVGVAALGLCYSCPSLILRLFSASMPPSPATERVHGEKRDRGKEVHRDTQR
jgi:SRSO17 transposase